MVLRGSSRSSMEARKHADDVHTVGDRMAIKTKVRNRGRWLSEVVAPMKLYHGIELGTHRAAFADAILSADAVQVLTCVDPWTGRFYPRENPEDRYKAALDRLEKHAGRTEIVRQKSLDVVDAFEDGSIDFIYIDALHVYEYPDGSGCNADIKAYWPKVRSGGVFSGHDYYSRHGCGVIRAVTEFEEREGIQVNLTRNGAIPTWWVVKP